MNIFKFDLSNVFNNKCLYDINGTLQPGPGIICWIYIIWSIIMTIIMLFPPKNLLFQQMIVQMPYANLFRFVDIIFSLVSIVFMYNMCIFI